MHTLHMYVKQCMNIWKTCLNTCYFHHKGPTMNIKPNKKDWQKLSFPTPIWENPNYEHKTPKNIIQWSKSMKRVKDYLRDVYGM